MHPHKTRIRALLDANILVSVLVSPDPTRSAAAALLECAEKGQYGAVVPLEALVETRRVAGEKPWLAARVMLDAIDDLVAVLQRVAEIAPPLTVVPPSVTRDPGDDYLLAQAVLSRVDYLVTRDFDLLSLHDAAGVRVVDPAGFLQILRSHIPRE